MQTGYQGFSLRSHMGWASSTTVYRVLGLTGDNASVLTAAWNLVKDKVPVRQTCICHSMNLCRGDVLDEFDVVKKMGETCDHTGEHLHGHHSRCCQRRTGRQCGRPDHDSWPFKDEAPNPECTYTPRPDSEWLLSPANRGVFALLFASIWPVSRTLFAALTSLARWKSPQGSGCPSACSSRTMSPLRKRRSTGRW